jgi:hypothetical protein
MPEYRMREPNAAASVYSTVRDLANWLRFQNAGGVWKGQRLVSARALGETHSPQITIPLEGITRQQHPDTNLLSYGLGWVVHDHRGQLVVAHNGVVNGYTVQLTLVPRTRLGIAVLANLHNTRMNLALTDTLLDRHFEWPRKDWNRHFQELERTKQQQAAEREQERLARRQTGTKPSREPAAYTGTFHHPAYGDARVVLERGALVWRWNQFDFRLEHFHFDTFLIHDPLLGTREFVFELAGDGTVQSCTADYGTPVKFQRPAKR